MFQAEPIKFLQSFSTEWLTDFFWFISQLGYSSFYIPALILLTFGLSLRRGFLLIQMMLWVGLVTDLLKNFFGLPRPSDVDSAVRLLADGIPNATPFTDMGGRGFWDLPDAEAIRIVRAQPEWSYGMPSGHVSGAVTFWGGLSLLFKPAAVKVAAILMIVLMPFSRMYLGRHFLADVLGGLFLGGLFLATAYALFIRAGTEARVLARSANPRTIAVIAALIGVPLVLPALSSALKVEDAGRLLGLNAAFLLLAWKGLPGDAASWPRRVGRFALAAALYAVTALLLGALLESGTLAERFAWVAFPAAAIPAFIALWGGVRLGVRLRLYSPLPRLD